MQKIPDRKTLQDLGDIIRIFWNQNSRFRVAKVEITSSRPSYFEGVEYFVSLTSAWNTKAGLLMLVDDLKPASDHSLTTRIYEEVVKKKLELEKMLTDKER